MPGQLTISQLNKIGERLRKDRATDDDLRLLDTYISSFTEAFDEVFATLSRTGLNPGGRPHKTTASIIAKLNREKTRLSTMQDIAGCRVEVQNRVEQDAVATNLQSYYPGASLQDRRKRPSHGYRAVHLIVKVLEHPIEIQIRTSLQHAWASATEKLADKFDDISIKYGGGPRNIRSFLIDLSGVIADFESIEAEYVSDREPIARVTKHLESQKYDLKRLCEQIIITLEAENQ